MNDLLNYYGRDNLDSATIKKVREIFEESGALKYSADLMNKYYDEALKDLDSISWIDTEKKEILQGFVDYLRERVK